ncbi:MAG TPA: stage II sporulation protein M [Nitrososphaeraceae archaeon]|jgi:Stage II sporulation protein M|nr:stage II sporulation protein M [Nitrososphaeraceae archaeon]
MIIFIRDLTFNYISVADKTIIEYNVIFYTLHFNIKRRLLYLAFGAVAFLIAYSAGATINMSKKEAEDLKGQFAKQIVGIDQNGIFINNVKVALGMFIPGIGTGIGIFSGISTGMVFSAMAETSPFISNVPPLIILLTPFGIMEVFAYGLAMSRSSMLIYQLVKKKPWREYTILTLIEIGIIVVVLFIGAVIEWQLIQFSRLDTNRPII